ncbi:hypothetical protein PG984_011873 [Apiospora sp. TS-2023a]
MGSPTITLTFVRNEPPPTIEDLPLAGDAPEHLPQQFAAADFAKQKLEELISRTNPITGHRRIKFTYQQLKLRALLTFLTCPDAEVGGLMFVPDDGLGFCTQVQELLGRWEKESARLFDEHGVQPGISETESGDKGGGYDKAMLLCIHTFKARLVWVFLKPFMDMVPDLLYGRAFEDLLALDESLLTLWRNCLINIRPLPCASQENEGRKLELQFLRFNGEDPVFADCIYEVNDQGAEGSREDNNPPLPLRSGDIYVLETNDPINHPLPSRELLTLRYHLQNALHAFKAKGVLEVLFGGPPPDVVGAEVLWSPERREHTSDFEEAVVREAVDQEVISSEDGLRWIVAIDNINFALEKRREKQRLQDILRYLDEEEDRDSD